MRVCTRRWSAGVVGFVAAALQLTPVGNPCAAKPGSTTYLVNRVVGASRCGNQTSLAG